MILSALWSSIRYIGTLVRLDRQVISVVFRLTFIQFEIVFKHIIFLLRFNGQQGLSQINTVFIGLVPSHSTGVLNDVITPKSPNTLPVRTRLKSLVQFVSYEIQVQFIDAWHQIWKLCEIHFWMKKKHLCVGLFVCNICTMFMYRSGFICWRPLLWRHNERDGVSNHQPGH